MPTKKISITKARNILITIVSLSVVGVLGYSVYSFENSSENTEGFFICNEDNTVCETSEHIHADITVVSCDEEVIFSKEKGRTDEMHTHKEKNYMHWHARLLVDPITRNPIDSSRPRATINAFLVQTGYTLPKECPTNLSPTAAVRVNEVFKKEGLDYVWVDGDDILVEYK